MAKAVPKNKMKSKVLIISLAILTIFFQGACTLLDDTISSVTGIVGMDDTATVIAKTAQIRTSYAVVAADLLEVKRGERLDLLDQMEFEKVLWYRVRAHDESGTEGWIEAQNVITSEILAKSKELAKQYENASAQASGSLRAASNLRLSPEIDPTNILYKLATGSNFEIMAWKFVPKEAVDDSGNADPDDPKSKTPDSDLEAAKEKGEPAKLDETYDIWYQVKLDPSVSPAPAGWIFGRQVDLQVPSEIVYFQSNNRKFVTWQRLDTDSANKVATDRNSTPGNWVILTRTNYVKAIDGVEPDFDGILVLAFDKYDQSYYTVWRTTGEVWGSLPMRVEGSGDNKTFTLRLRSGEGKMDDKQFVVFRDKNRLRVTPPEDLAQYEQTKAK